MAAELEEFLKSYLQKIEEDAEELRGEKMPVLTEELFALFETTGNRLKYEEVYFRRRKHLAVFGMLSIIKGRSSDIRKLEEIMLDICLEECWALPAHVNRRDNPLWKITIDLFAAETAQTLAELITLLRDKISSAVYAKVRENIFSRVLTPFYSSEAPYGNWEYSTHNWCAVCSGSIGSASIYLLTEESDVLDKAVSRIRESLKYYIAGFPEDGACMEGIGYFTYGMTYFTTFARQVFDYSHGEIDLMKDEKVKRIAEFQQKCYFADGLTVNFSDGDSHTRYKMGLTACLAMEYDTVRIPPVSLGGRYDTDNCFRWAAIYRDYLWTKEYAEALKAGTVKAAKEDFDEGDILPFAQWSILRSRNGAGLAVKGGHNDEPHNHNDVGSFLYVYKKSMLLAELGAGEYTREYFGSGRYEILCNSSLGHSVPIINGEGQCQGREYSCGGFYGDGKGTTRLDMEKAYRKNSIEKIERELTFHSENGTVRLCDRFIGSEETVSVKENLISLYEPSIEGNTIRLKGEDGSCSIKVEDEVFAPEVVACIHKEHDGTPREVYLIQWELPLHKEMKSSFVIIPEDVDYNPDGNFI